MMKQYCELCEKHCPVEDLGCGEGRRALAAEALLDEMDAEPEARGEMDELRPRHRPPHEFGGPGHHQPPFPPREGPGPRGPHPRPRIDPEELLRRSQEAGTMELFDICHRVLHRPDVGGIHGQGRALTILAERGEMNQRELQDVLRVAPGSMSELLAKMERKGLLVRERGEDRRANLLRITDAGREAAGEIRAPGEEIFSALSEEQREEFRGMLRVLLADWVKKEE